MATRFEKAPLEALEIIALMKARYHQPLEQHGVTIEAVFAFAEVDEDSAADPKAAVTCNGYPCAAKVKIMSLADRTLGSADARITVDGDEWEILSQEQREALIDHELAHCRLVEKVVKGQVVIVRDDLGRCKLKLDKHDWQFGWFDSIVRRHGRNSPEWRQWEAFEEKRIRLWLPHVSAAE